MEIARDILTLLGYFVVLTGLGVAVEAGMYKITDKIEERKK